MSEIINAVVPIEAIIPHPRNYKKHPESQIYKLKKSHERFKQYRSVVIWQRPDGGYIQVAGHGIVKAMKERGVTQVRADILPEDTPQEDIDGILAADNLLPEESEDDEELLAHLLQEQHDAGFDLAALGTDDETLRQMLEALGDDILAGDEGDGTGGDEFDTTPEDGPTRTHVGELWQLGKHRLLVGDSTDPKQVARLMQGEKALLFATDPPYGANAGNIGFTAQRDEIDVITNDDLKDEHMQAWLELVFRTWAPYLDNHAAWYLWHPMLTQGYFAAAAAAAAADILIHRQIIWVKPQFIFGRGDYHWKHELCFYGWRKGYRPEFYGERNQHTVWEIEYNEKRAEIGHPTPKPLELFAIPMRNHTKSNALCAEPFAGSGAQIIAAERENRRCYAMELIPKYADICLRRYEAETGQTAHLLERIEEPSHV